jgi:uncharacterized spore protein YtfJ
MQQQSLIVSCGGVKTVVCVGGGGGGGASVKYDIVFVIPNGAIRIKIPPFDSA